MSVANEMILFIIGLITKTQKIIKHINLLRMSENILYSFNTVRNAFDASTYFE
jgi:Zn-dependent membrane protease YugP